MILKNATLFQISPAVVDRSDLRIEGGVITGRGKHLKGAAGEETVDLGGRLIMPGLVCAHTHLYSTLSRGMPGPRSSPKNFVRMLKNIWWKLDRALDDESIYYSALAGALEAVRSGTTTIVDHHASPNSIAGSLDLIAAALTRAGIRGVLCYETTDRGGRKRRDAGLGENDRFLGKHRTDPRLRGLVGAHASFTLGNDSLHELGRIVEIHDSGIHIHAAEDVADVDDARRRWRSSIADRLEDHGLLRSRSLLVHGIHLSGKERKKIARSGAWIVHNPRSNMNNAVGRAPVEDFGRRTALGTDGFPADMLEESRTGLFRLEESGYPRSVDRFSEIMQAGQEMVSEIFDRKFGALGIGTPADLVVLDYRPATPVLEENAPSHFFFGLRSSMVESVLIDGKWIVWNREFVSLDEESIMREARRAAEELWKRIEALRS